MTDTLTTTLRLTQPTVGGDSGTWGGLLNSDLAYVDAAVNGTVTVNVSDTNATLTVDGSASDQGRYAVYNITGAWTANRTITLPGNSKLGWVTNGTSGGHNVILSAGGTTLYVPPGATFRFQCDGTDVLPLGPLQRWTQTASGASSLAIPLFSQFSRFRLHLLGMTVSTLNASLGLQFSSDTGANYKNTNYAENITDTASGVAGPPSSTSIATSISVSVSLPAAGAGWTAHLDIFPGAVGLRTCLTGRGFGARGDSAYTSRNVEATWDSTAGRMDYCKLTPTSGTMSGTVHVEASV